MLPIVVSKNFQILGHDVDLDVDEPTRLHPRNLPPLTIAGKPRVGELCWHPIHPSKEALEEGGRPGLEQSELEVKSTAAGGEVRATVALDHVTAKHVETVDADDKLWPPECVCGLVGDVEGEVPDKVLFVGLRGS